LLQSLFFAGQKHLIFAKGSAFHGRGIYFFKLLACLIHIEFFVM